MEIFFAMWVNIFVGKIVQNTVDECREAYALWIELVSSCTLNFLPISGILCLSEVDSL